MATNNEKTSDKKVITDIFVEGARNGWNMGIKSVIPNVLMAYVVIQALNVSGLLELFGNIFAPLMTIFGLPGEAAAVLLSSWMSMPGGVGVAVSLFNEGLLNGIHLTILTPAIFLMGAQIQYAGRLLGTAEVNQKHTVPLMIISIVNALISMLIMRVIIIIL